jgi:hypothetical protein
MEIMNNIETHEKFNKIRNNDTYKDKINELKKLFLIKKQNIIILKKLKHTYDILDNTIDSLLLQISQKEKEIDLSNNLFLENNKHFKFILLNLL